MIFTQLTSKGSPIYHDLYVELAVMDLRRVLGKVYRTGMDLKMEHECTAVPTQQSEKLEAKNLRNNEATRSESSASVPYSEFSEDVPFFPVFEHIWDMDLWTPGAAPTIGVTRSGNPILAKTDVLEVPGREGGKLHASILLSITIFGEERVREYFLHNHIRDLNRVICSEIEGGVSLRKMNTTNLNFR